MTTVNPNLTRIPGDGDHLAENILRGLPEIVDAEIVGTLTDTERVALGRYGYRTLTFAMRSGNASLCHDALLATSLGVDSDEDPRDVMIGLALHFVVAEMVGKRPSAVFGAVADRLPSGWVADLLRQFGDRDDISLKSFGWRLVQTPKGADFEPEPYPWA